MMGLPTCREIAAQLSREQDAAEPTPHRLSLRLHLMMCRHCRRYERQLVWLRQSLTRARADNTPPRLSASAQKRIHKRLQDDDSKPPTV